LALPAGFTCWLYLLAFRLAWLLAFRLAFRQVLGLGFLAGPGAWLFGWSGCWLFGWSWGLALPAGFTGWLLGSVLPAGFSAGLGAWLYLLACWARFRAFDRFMDNRARRTLASDGWRKGQ
jgi:hypothetical protein